MTTKTIPNTVDALDLTRKVLDLAQAWIDKEGLGT